MEKLDLRRELKHLYSGKADQVNLVDVPRFSFLMIDGAIEKEKSPGISLLYW